MNPIDRLIQAFGKLPGVGQKSAARFAFHILRAPAAEAHELAEAVIRVKTQTQLCSSCLTFTPSNPCRICSDTRREQQTICVVEKPADVSAIEQTGVFRGVYHVLHGLLSPLSGIGPDDLKIDALLTRLRASPATEVIVATNPTVEGEATAMYLATLIRPIGVRLTRLASGIPLGGEVEYASPQTLARAIESRHEVL
ncbi:MAG: recombination protein RecR [Deltaproteobacteria bacterium]|nr:recombination protein RecR [Deltaproteobacteria bacterium]